MSELIETRDRILFNRILDNPEHILYELLPEKRQKILRKRDHPSSYLKSELKDLSVLL
jgi:hypothetical protein